MGVTEQLARFAIETDGRFLTPAMAESAKSKILDTFATMIAGSQAPSSRISLETVRELGGTPQATVIGWGYRTSMPHAGFVNGNSAHALEYDDNTAGAGHVSGCVLPGCLSVAEHLDLSGRGLIEAFAMGFEVFCRMAHGLRPFIIDRGWHPQAVLGGQGVAVAACRMFGLDQMTARMAMGIVASSATGVRKNVGSMGKAFHVANGVRAGIFAAMLARNEFKVDPDIIEGSDEVADGHERFGLADTFNGIGNYRLERMLEDLGGTFELSRNTTMVRLHPGSSAPGAAIDGMIDLAISHELSDAEVEDIHLECTPECYAIAPYKEPTDVYKAKFCLRYTMAVALIDRKVGLEQYSLTRIRDERVHRLMHRVTVSVPDDLKRHKGQWGENGVNWGEARISVRLKDGSVLRQACSQAKGWPERPASWQDLCEKFEDCASPVLEKVQIRNAIATIGKLEELRSVRDLVKLLVPARAN
ncbi:MAG: MmgE/PrpD family protein [Burkholderiales bacterium]